MFAMVLDSGKTSLSDGYAIVCPVRKVDSISELTELEYLEMFVCAQEISKKFEEQFQGIKSF